MINLNSKTTNNKIMDSRYKYLKYHNELLFFFFNTVSCLTYCIFCVAPKYTAEACEALTWVTINIQRMFYTSRKMCLAKSKEYMRQTKKAHLHQEDNNNITAVFFFVLLFFYIQLIDSYTFFKSVVFQVQAPIFISCQGNKSAFCFLHTLQCIIQ